MSYAEDGTLQWTEQLGSNGDDYSLGVSADGLGNVYISGWTDGNLDGTNTGDLDAFVSKFDSSGTLKWIRQLGTNNDDQSFGISADGLGDVYTSGNTQGNLEGTSAGGIDAFVAKFSNVPEPGTLLLAALGCMGFLLLTKRRFTMFSALSSCLSLELVDGF